MTNWDGCEALYESNAEEGPLFIASECKNSLYRASKYLGTGDEPVMRGTCGEHVGNILPENRMAFRLVRMSVQCAMVVFLVSCPYGYEVRS